MSGITAASDALLPASTDIRTASGETRGPGASAIPSDTDAPAGVALGLGCDRNTPWQTLASAIGQALTEAGAGWAQVRAVASIDLKADEPAMQELMRQQGCRIVFYPAGQLARVEVPNPSEVVRKYTGTPSVSEAAALLVAGHDGQPAPISALLVEKHKLRGADGRNATVSVARILF